MTVQEVYGHFHHLTMNTRGKYEGKISIFELHTDIRAHGLPSPKSSVSYLTHIINKILSNTTVLGLWIPMNTMHINLTNN